MGQVQPLPGSCSQAHEEQGRIRGMYVASVGAARPTGASTCAGTQGGTDCRAGNFYLRLALILNLMVNKYWSSLGGPPIWSPSALVC